MDFKPLTALGKAGVMHFAQTLIDIGAKYGGKDVKNILPHRHQISAHSKTLLSKKEPSYCVLSKWPFKIMEELV